MQSILDELLSAMHAVWNRRWVALGVAWLICLLGWLAIAMFPNSYESTARIFVQLDDPLAKQIGMDPGDQRREIERIRQTLTSAVNLEKVVRSTRLGEDIANPRQLEATVLDLAEHVEVVSQQDSLFEITAQSGRGSLSDAENARLAQDVVQKLIDIFREENLSGNRGEMTETLQFVDQQLASREKELEAAEQRRLAFESQHPEMIQGGVANLQRLEAARSEIRGVDADLAAAQSALAAINGQLAGTPQTLPGGTTGSAQGALSQAQSQLAGMKGAGLTDQHPDVIALRNQIAQLRPQAERERAAGSGGVPNPAYSSLQSIRADRQASVQSLATRRAALQTDIASLTANQSANPQIAAEAAKIGRDYDVLKSQYDKLLQDREVLKLRGEVKTEREAVRFQVVDPPTTPRTPVAPNRLLLLAGVLIAGLGGGIAAAFALGQLRSTFATTAKLERATGLPVLGAISQTMTQARRAVRQRQLKFFAAGTAALCGLFAVLMVVEFIQRGMVA